MASTQTTEVFNCSVDEFYKILSDYNKYPEFLSEVKECKVLQDEGEKKLVSYDISLIKSFNYNLWMTEQVPNKISWVLDSGDLFKVNSGSWELTDEAGKCRATYSLEVKAKLFIPGPVMKTLTEVNLPNMMSSYHKRVSELYGG